MVEKVKASFLQRTRTLVTLLRPCIRRFAMIIFTGYLTQKFNPKMQDFKRVLDYTWSKGGIFSIDFQISKF